MLYLRVNKIRGQNYIYFLNWKQMKNFSQEMLHNKKNVFLQCRWLMVATW